MLAQRSVQASLDDAEVVSLTVVIEDRFPAQGKRFAFRAVRQLDHTPDRPRDREPEIEHAFLIRDERPDGRAVVDHVDAHSSAPFLAAAIAQSRPSPVLHNPPYRQAAGAYRRSDSLGLAGPRLSFRSDKRV